MATLLALPGGGPPSTAPPPSDPAKGKPVIVRVKRKASEAPLDALWVMHKRGRKEQEKKTREENFIFPRLEESDVKEGLAISERPPKRPTLDLSSLSISDTDTAKVSEELGTKKLLIHYVDTVRHSEAITNVLHFLLQDSNNRKEFKRRSKGHKHSFKPVKGYSTKQDRLRSVARKEHEDLGRNARFKQIWKRRGSLDAEENALHEMCHLYDVIRVDAKVERQGRAQKLETVHDGYSKIFSNYLPLMREFLPQAAVEIEHNMESVKGDYVYDLYTVGDGLDASIEDAMEYPLVQVNDDDDEYYGGPWNSGYESDDSNAEDNPRNDYPDEDEESSGDEDECDYTYLEGSDSEY